MAGHIVGYARVSSADQNLARQIEALGDVAAIYEEKASAGDMNRPVLQDLIKYIAPGTIVRVKSPDRLARSTRDLLDIIERLKSKGASVEFIDNPALNTDTPQGEFMLTILGAVAQLERATIRERQLEGIALAKKRGVYDRTPKLTPEQIEEARQRIEARVPKAVVARDLGVSRTTLYAALAGEGRYAQRAA